MIHVYTMTYQKEEGTGKRKTEHELGLSLLSLGLREVYSLELNGLRIETEAKGKPYFPDFPYIFFNISHCDGLAACAIGDVPIGIDVEKVRSYRPTTARRVLSERERSSLEELLPAKREEGFFRFWTLKESYVKAVGCGISIALSKVEFALGSVGLCRLVLPEASESGYNFYQEIQGDYVLSLCVKGKFPVVFAPCCVPNWKGMETPLL